VPVVGVAFSDWDDARLRGYAVEAAEGTEDRGDGTALKELAGSLAMVSGDYRDPATWPAPGCLQAGRNAGRRCRRGC